MTNRESEHAAHGDGPCDALVDEQCLGPATDQPGDVAEKQPSTDGPSANDPEVAAKPKTAIDESFSRREFVAGGIAAAFLCAGGASLAYVAPSQSLLRPPGGQDEEFLISRCVHCYRCISACPEHCLVAAKLETGLLNMRTPSIDFTKGFCTFCDVCMDVCITEAIKPFNRETEKIGIAVIDREKCVAYKKPGSCSRCIDSCKYDAIELSADSIPVVDVDLCNGCGACEYVCPSDSFMSYTASGHRGIYVALQTEAGE